MVSSRWYTITIRHRCLTVLWFVLHVGNLDALGQAISKLGDERQDLVSRNHSARPVLRCKIPNACLRDLRYQDRGHSHPRCPLTCRDNYCRRASMPHCRSDLQKENGKVAKEGRWPSNSTNFEQHHDIDSITPERQTPNRSTTDRKSCIVESVQSRDRRQVVQQADLVPNTWWLCPVPALRPVVSEVVRYLRPQRLGLDGDRCGLWVLCNFLPCRMVSASGEREPCAQS
jgi:hypothetical protein